MDLKKIAREILSEDKAHMECAMDFGTFTMSLEEHDKRYHKGAYRPGSYCAYREWLRASRGLDGILTTGSLTELRRQLVKAEDTIREMREANAIIVSNEREELRQLNSQPNLTSDDEAHRRFLSEDIFRREEMELYIPVIARAKLLMTNNGGGRVQTGTVAGIPDTQMEAFQMVVERMFAKSILPPVSVNIRLENIKRSYSTPQDIVLSKVTNIPVMIHELGHVIEHNNPRVLQLTSAFLDYRCGGEKYINLKEIDRNYDDGEKARRDKFFDPYCGKEYRKWFRRPATEILSRGVEEIIRHPLAFLDEDPEYFRFCINLIRGEI